MTAEVSQMPAEGFEMTAEFFFGTKDSGSFRRSFFFSVV